MMNGAMPHSAIRRGPKRSTMRPINGITTSPISVCNMNENVNSVRLQPSSRIIGSMNTPLENE